MKSILLTCLCFTLSFFAHAQVDSIAVQTVEGTVNEVLETITQEKGSTPDWDALRALFLPTARFTVIQQRKGAPPAARTITLEEYIKIMSGIYPERSFKEVELGKVVEEYNGLAHVFQSFHATDSEGYSQKGINSFQLVYFDDRWWIVNVAWTNAGKGEEIPNKYLNR